MNDARMQPLAALVAGLLLGSGLMLSGMTDPGKVLAFLDWRGTWNPALIGVLGGAVLVSLAGFRYARQMAKPWFDQQFHTPTRRDIDFSLLAGSILFGLGWGLAGYCPGPALVGAVLGNPEAPEFLVAMVLGGLAQGYWQQARARKAAGV